MDLILSLSIRSHEYQCANYLNKPCGFQRAYLFHNRKYIIDFMSYFFNYKMDRE